jgi:ParB/RepB/Spo0J family partition protein
MTDTSALPETSDLPGENPVGQIALFPDKALELENGWVTLAELEHERVPEPPKTLLASIRRFGLLQPILVRATEHVASAIEPDAPNYHHDIVFGRRRLAVCRALGIDPIPAIIVETDLAIADVMTLAENALRTSNPIGEYDAIERLVKAGATIKDISGATGMSQGTIKARQRLFNLDPTLLDAFRSSRITVSVAEAAAKLPKAIQKDLAVAQFATGKLTMTDIHNARTVRMQRAMGQIEPLIFPEDVATPEDLGATSDEPPEFDQANRLSQLADEIDPAQGTIIRSLRWCAAILMDIATGQRTEIVVKSEELGLPPGDDIPITVRAMKEDEIAEFRYVTGQGVPSDATPHEAEVAQPNRVFTVTKIEEPEDEPDGFLEDVFE